MVGPAEWTREREDVAAPLLALGAAARKLAAGAPVDDGLAAIAEAIGQGTGSEVALVRVLDEGGRSLEARTVVSSSPALAAELQGSRVPAGVDFQPRVAAERLGLGVGLHVPITVGEAVRGRLELYRRGGPFTVAEDALARLGAEYAALALASSGADGNGSDEPAPPDLLRLGGDALAAGLDQQRAAEQIALLAARGTGAIAAAVWRIREDGAVSLLGTYGEDGFDAGQVEAALESASPLSITAAAWTLRLGQPPLGAVELRFEQPLVPSDALLDSLATFAARAAHALRTSEGARRQAVELERSRALVAVVGQAIAQLSLSHTLETAIDRVAELLGAERLAVYLIDEDDDSRLAEAAGRGLAGPHTRVADRLLALARGPLRGHDAIEIADAGADSRLRAVREQLAETGIETAVAVPLRVHEDLIGLLAVYLERGRSLTPDELALVTALGAQLAVAVQNARLHEQVKRRDAERREALEAEQTASRTVGSLYEISRTFAQSLSLETTLEAIVRTMTELLGIDAVGIRMPDERQEALVTQALHVRDERMAPAVKAVLFRPQPFSPRLRELFAGGRPLVLNPAIARELGGSYGLLTPFLEKGSTTAIVPLSTQAEVLGTLTLLSLDPGRPLGHADVELALSVAGQAALALENARLYQQQKRFADTMQRSLLPREQPQIDGIDVAAVYESSARLDVGGDVYDFLTLDDGRLAVVLGDVTGHGVDATADMAMAKFVFRSLAREHPEPADFLSVANDVVVGEVAQNKFVSMLYLTIDPTTGEVACASAGHPWPRIVGGDGTVRALRARGMVLGVDSDQAYEEVRHTLPAGAALVLYTDGVIEARRGAELYGNDRLDESLAARAAIPAEALAEAVVADCRVFTGGELTDDCAVVVIRRTV